MAVIILHGTKGSAEGNWFPWLKAELAHQDIKTFVPALPTPHDQSLKNWFKAFDAQVPALSASDTLIGHSCGAVFALRLLERSQIKIKKTILVAGLTDTINIPEYDALNASFLENGFDWQKIRQSSESFFVLCGLDDPYVPFSQSEELAAGLGCELTVIEKGGHLNSESGFTAFPQILPLLD